MMYLLVLRWTFAVFVLFADVNFCLNYDSFDPTLSVDQWEHHVCISGKSGNDSKECLKSCDTPCRHLDYVFENIKEQNQTVIYMEWGHHFLNKSYMFRHVKGLALIGNRSELGDVVIQCEKNAGLAYIYSSEIILRNVILTSCGALRRSTSFQYPNFLAALFLVNCTDFSMNSVKIENSTGIGIQLYDVVGVVNISNSYIYNNGRRNKEHSIPGGGFYFEFTFSGVQTYQKYGKFHFSNVWFVENTAPSVAKSVNPNEQFQNAFGRGGGASFFIKGSAQHNTFVFENCHFYGNTAEWGAGLFVEFQDNTRTNSMIFQSCHFINNTASLGGGGVRIGLITMSESLHSIPNWIHFTSCHFVKNKATLGGGIALYGTTKQSYSGFPEFSFANFTHCWIKNNLATLGSAFSLTLWNTNEYGIGSNKALKVYIANSRIEMNKIIANAEDMVFGTGALYSKSVPILLADTVFCNNTNTALVLDNAIVQIIGNVSFLHNTGQRGGAMSLYGLSWIKVSNWANLTFFENSCQLKGGAIYVTTPGPKMVAFKSTELKVHRCFFEFDSGNNYNVSFHGNRGPNKYSGNSVYATTLQFCRHTNESRVDNSALQWDSFNYFYANGTKSNMKYEIVTEAINMEINPSDWNTIPDKSFSPVVKLTDEKSNSVMGVIKISVKSKNKARLDPPLTYFLGKNKIKSLRINAKPKTRYDINLETVESQLLSRNISNAEIENCSPGFVWDGSSCKCDRQNGVSRCDDKNKALFLLKGFWGGYENENGAFAVAPCPENYCNCIQNNLTSSGECHFDMNKRCAGNRGDQLCGICKKGYTLYVGEDKCSSKSTCNSRSMEWIGYFIGILVFLTFLVIVIMHINFDPFSSYLNAWLYSYQVLKILVHGNIDFDCLLTFIDGLSQIQITGFGGICLWSNMNDLVKLAFNYLLPFYFFACLLVLHKFVLKWPNNIFTRRLTQTSCARAFCTIFVLSYSTVVNISFKILSPVEIGDHYYVYYQGTLRYWCHYYIPFFTCAIVFVSFVGILFPLILIRREWFQCIDNGLKKLLLDNFQRCFRDGYQWCAGFYFVCRFILLVIGRFVPQGALHDSLLNSVCCITLTVFVLCRPYVGEGGTIIPYKILNISDAVLLCNLCLISSFSGAISATHIVFHYKIFETIIKILSYIPLLFSLGLLGYVLRHRYLTYNRLLENVD